MLLIFILFSLESVTPQQLVLKIVKPCAVAEATLHKLLNRQNAVNANTIGAVM